MVGVHGVRRSWSQGHLIGPVLPSQNVGAPHNPRDHGEVGARRTRDWIESGSTWEEISQPIDVAPWAQHVKHLAEEVLVPEPRPDWCTGSLAMLEFGLGDRKHAEAAHEQGLAAFFPASDPKASMAALQLLDVSGRSPAPLPVDLTEESARSLFSPTARGWKVTVPRGLGPVGSNFSLSSWIERG